MVPCNIINPYQRTFQIFHFNDSKLKKKKNHSVRGFLAFAYQNDSYNINDFKRKKYLLTQFEIRQYFKFNAI